MQVVFVRDGVELVSWTAVMPDVPDLTVVDALATLQLRARRSGGRIQLRDVPDALAALLDQCGLRVEVGG